MPSRQVVIVGTMFVDDQLSVGLPLPQPPSFGPGYPSQGLPVYPSNGLPFPGFGGNYPSQGLPVYPSTGPVFPGFGGPVDPGFGVRPPVDPGYGRPGWSPVDPGWGAGRPPVDPGYGQGGGFRPSNELPNTPGNRPSNPIYLPPGVWPTPPVGPSNELPPAGGAPGMVGPRGYLTWYYSPTIGLYAVLNPDAPTGDKPSNELPGGGAEPKE